MMRSSSPSSVSPGRRLAIASVLMVVLGCQTYDFEPVTPVALGQTTTSVSISAKQLKPNLMLALDRSGSMRLPFDPTPAACGTCGQSGQPSCDPVACPSRWDVLTSTANDFLTQHGTVARMGVAFYPSLSGTNINDPGSGQPSNFCGPASGIDVGLPSSDDDTALRDGAAAVDFAIKRVGATASPLAGGLGGGTPTGDSLAYIAEHANFGSTIQRQSFLLLMTDGLPNCNPASGLNANVNPAACDCTDGASSTAVAATMASTVRSRFLRRTFSARVRRAPARIATLWGRSTVGIFPRMCQIAASLGAPVATSARITAGMRTR